MQLLVTRTDSAAHDGHTTTPFFAEFAKLLKATISYVMSVRPSVRLSPARMEQLGSHWTDFDEI